VASLVLSFFLNFSINR